MGSLVRLLEEKRAAAERLLDRLGEGSARRATRDHHSRRKPRPCGMTIHTGVGCSYACAYCYIYDMGFPASPRPYPLTPLELVYALCLNPYVVPGRTMAAFGSVTEPFLPETKLLALEYARSVWHWLKLPEQISTKSVIDEEVTRGLLGGDPLVNVLVTVVTLRNRRLEPRAPDPRERLEAAARAIRQGLRVTLFLRPVIPGAHEDAYEVVRAASEVGLTTVVIGSLRVTERILARLRAVGVDVGEIVKRVGKPPRGSRQVSVPSEDLKSSLTRVAEECGLRVFRAACEANAWSHGLRCSMCSAGPCNSEMKPPEVSREDVADLLDYLGVRFLELEVSDSELRAKLGRRDRRSSYLKYLLSVATYRRVKLLT